MKEEPHWNNELITKQSDKIIALFKSIHKTFTCKFQEFARQYGFTAPQLAVIFHLYKTPGITLNELSSHLMLTKSTVSGIVDRLVKQKVVIRQIPKDNRRIVKLSISEDFKKNNNIVNIKEDFITSCISNAIKNITPEHVEEIIYALENFISVLNKENNN